MARTMLARQLLLDREDVLQHAGRSAPPRCGCRQRVDQLAGDPDAIGRLADAAFQHVADAELAADRAGHRPTCPCR